MLSHQCTRNHELKSARTRPGAFRREARRPRRVGAFVVIAFSCFRALSLQKRIAPMSHHFWKPFALAVVALALAAVGPAPERIARRGASAAAGGVERHRGALSARAK